MSRLGNYTGRAPSTACGTTESKDVRSAHTAVQMTIYGVCYSMKNSKIPRRHGRGMVKHPKALAYEADFAAQVPRHCTIGMGSRQNLVRAIVTVYYPSWRQDGDFALIYDLLQKTGVVSNDRWIREKHEYAEVDPKNPRAEIVLELI